MDPDKQKIFFGMLKANSKINIDQAASLLAIDAKDLELKLYEFVADNTIQGSFQGRDFIISAGMDQFMQALDSSFNQWAGQEKSKIGKIENLTIQSGVGNEFHLQGILSSNKSIPPMNITSSQTKILFHNIPVAQSESDVLFTFEKQIGKELNVNKDENPYCHIKDGHVVKLSISNLKELLTTVPENIGELLYLQELILSNNDLTILPESIGKLQKLTILDLYGTKLRSLPESIGNLINLENLQLHIPTLKSLPKSFGNLDTLRYLTLCDVALPNFPEELRDCRALVHLNISGAGFKTLPDWFRYFNKLRDFFLRKEEFDGFPKEVKSMLKEMKKKGCNTIDTQKMKPLT